MALDFTGQRCVVTGGGRGMGREYALLLAARGASVVVNKCVAGFPCPAALCSGSLCAAPPPSGPDAPALTRARNARSRTPEKADEVVAEITAAGGTAIADYSDVATAGEQAVEACVAAFGGIDVLISNAGQLEDRSLKNMTVEEFTSVVTTHAIGGFRAMKGAWPHMNEQKKGRIVFIGSIAAWYGGFGQGNCAFSNGRALALSPQLTCGCCCRQTRRPRARWPG